MKCIFFCQSVDVNHPTQALVTKWIELFANHSQMEEVFVLTRHKGEFTLPENVKVFAIQKNNLLLRGLEWYSVLIRLLRENAIGFFWINQDGYLLPLMLLPVKLALNIPIYQWRVSPLISPQMEFCARYCARKIFTCTSKSFPMNLPNVRVVGHGIDVETFRIKNVKKTGELVTTGRMTPDKHLDLMVRMLDKCRHQFGTAYSLDIYGNEAPEQPKYRQTLERLIEERHLTEYVSFKGQVKHAELPDMLNSYKVFLNCSETALDKAVVEAMACGLPVIATNPCVEEILPEDLRPLLYSGAEDVSRLAQLLHALLSQPDAYLEKMGYDLREVAVKHHSVKRLVNEIFAEIGNNNP